MIELLDALEEQTLDDDAGRADDNWNDDKRWPIADADMAQQQERCESAHHILRAVGEIDDVEHAEDDGKPQAQQRIERAVDQAQ